MKRVLIFTLLCVLLVFGCSKAVDKQEKDKKEITVKSTNGAEIAIEVEGEEVQRPKGNLYEQENTGASKIGNFIYILPESWLTNKEEKEEAIYYYGDGIMLTVIMIPIEVSDEESFKLLMTYFDGFVDTLEAVKNEKRAIVNIKSGEAAIELTANVISDGGSQDLHSIAVYKNGELYNFIFSVSTGTFDYSTEIEEFKKNLTYYEKQERTLQSSELIKKSDTSDDNPNIPLDTGKYIVGEDIPEGKYNVFGVQSGLFKVSSKGTEYGDICSEIIDPKEGVYHNLTLKDGDTVELTSGGCVILIVQ